MTEYIIKVKEGSRPNISMVDRQWMATVCSRQNGHCHCGRRSFGVGGQVKTPPLQALQHRAHGGMCLLCHTFSMERLWHGGLEWMGGDSSVDVI